MKVVRDNGQELILRTAAALFRQHGLERTLVRDGLLRETRLPDRLAAMVRCHLESLLGPKFRRHERAALRMAQPVAAGTGADGTR